MIVKICGITRQEDADAAEGADWIGFNFWPRSKRYVTVENAAKIETRAKRVGVFVNATREEIRRAVEGARLDLVQLHGDEPPGFWTGPHIRAVRVGPSVDWAAYDDDILLLDAPSAGYGGSGTTFDWTVVKQARRPGRKILVAGGLTPENVAQAIAAAAPDGVDVAGGVESAPGVKDHDKLRRFVTAAKGR